MVRLAEVLRRHWPAYEQKFGARLLPSHRRAVSAVMSCRTAALGGHLYGCGCGQEKFVYHSCNHHACPQCGHADATAWLGKQQARLLPVTYWMITFTVSDLLRAVIRRHQKELYDLLLRESAQALLDVARDHKDLGAQIAILAVLQTWTRDLRFHPHVHCVVPGGGLSRDGLRWVNPRRQDYLLPQKALARRFRTRLKQALQKRCPELLAQIPAQAWRKDWVVDVRPVGSGKPALKYLAAYVYRSAFSSEKIVADANGRIAFGYRDNSGQSRTATLGAEEFLHRFLDHVMPRGFQRVRYFGFLAPAAKKKWQRVVALLDWTPPPIEEPKPAPVPACPHCKQPMTLIRELPRPPPDPLAGLRDLARSLGF